MKVIPAELVANKAKHSTTLCLLRKIGPLADGSYRYQCSLDRDVTYDDGAGEQTYKARIGYEASALVSSSDLGVDNAEGQMLAPLAAHELEGITKAQVEAGALDKVPFVVYEIDYTDLTPGRHEIRNGGTLGEVKWKYQDNILIPEERSLSQQLKQNVGEVYSLTCRATFGSQPIGTGGGVVEERFPCGFDVSALWVDVLVTSVDADEPDLVFADSALTQADDFFEFGVITCTAGMNAGQTREIESFAGGQFVLRFPFTQPVAIADAFSARPGCSKRRDGNNGCKHWWDMAWGLHFRGEPHMPVSEASKIMVPGAGIHSIGSPGTGEVATPPVSAPSAPPSIPVGAGVLNVDAYGAVGDGTTDDTAAWNAAIAALPAGGGTVQGTSGKTYLIDAEVSVKPTDNTKLDLTGITLKAKTTSSDAYAVILCDLVDNVEIANGTIQGDRATHTGVGGEQGHCIRVKGSTNISIHDLTLKDGWGDGAVIGPNKNNSHAYVYSQNVYIADCVIDNNRRNGLSIGNVIGCQVLNNTIKNTNGTSPQCGIDVEPDSDANGVGYCGDVLIDGNDIFGNAVYGINVFTKARDVTISNNTIHDNDSCGVVVSGAGQITVADNTIHGNGSTGCFYQNGAFDGSVSGNTFYQNHGAAARSTPFDQTGASGVAKDLLIGATTTNISVGTNHYQ